MRPPEMQERPGRETGATPKQTHNVQPQSSAITDLPLLARRADYALRVVSRRRDGHALTRYFATLRGAEGAVRRAADRGQPAVLQLVRISPTSIAISDVAHLLDDGEVDR